MSETGTQANGGERGAGAALLWACFLACSWTWVVGMLFPLLLVRQFGLAGWIAFAVPNVVGAAAMGFVLARPGASAAMVERHEAAALRFSEITVAFHIFAVGWFFTMAFGFWSVLAAAAVALAVLGAMRIERGVLGAGALLAAGSAVAILAWLASADGGVGVLPEGTRAGWELAMLVPALAFGFLLCPYLDLSFHRARQATAPGAGRAAFAIGFGVIFLAFIAFALAYGPGLIPLLADPQAVPGGEIMTVLGLYMAAQAGFTVAVHVREIAHRRGHAGLHRLFVLGIAGGALGWWAFAEPTVQHGMQMGEVIYRGFLLFYGVVFPLYVLICMVPAWRGPVAGGRRFAIYVGAVAASLPFAYVALVMGRTGWVGVVFAVVVAARGVLEAAVARGGGEARA